MGQPGAPPGSAGIEHVHRRVKRCRIVNDRIRLWKAGIRALVMAIRCALHHFRVRHYPLADDGLIGIEPMIRMTKVRALALAQRLDGRALAHCPGALLVAQNEAG